MMSKTTNELLMELIDVLQASCTQEYDDGVVSHEHNLFDNIDQDKLDTIKAEVHELILIENK